MVTPNIFIIIIAFFPLQTKGLSVKQKAPDNSEFHWSLNNSKSTILTHFMSPCST